MSEVTRILTAIEQGDPHAANELLPLVYDELRRLAAQKLAHEATGQTLEATALVHEAYIRLMEVDKAQHWNSRGHFFAAAAEAMRRILVENCRRKASRKRGGSLLRQPLPETELVAPALSDDLLALDEALTQLAQTDTLAAELVKLRYSLRGKPPRC
jgi:RNA polymerase sigma factor (TIGR02999 family)